MKTISSKALKDFKKVYFEVTKKEISDEVAYKYAEAFMELFIIAITKKTNNNYNNKK